MKIGHSAESGDTSTADERRLFENYLGDHRAGAAAGVELARRRASQNDGSDFAALLHDLHQQLQDDRDSLDRLARRLGVETPQWKAVLGTFGAKLGVVKLSGRVLSYSPLSRVLEAEALIMAIEGKRELWDVLRAVGPTSDRNYVDELDRLADRPSRRSGVETARGAATAPPRRGRRRVRCRRHHRHSAGDRRVKAA